MSARVLNPVVFSEFYKIRTPSAGAIKSTIRKNVFQQRQENQIKVDRIKKDLFGATNRIETKKIFEEEIKKHQELACKKWGFDFRNGQPLQENSPYLWERVPCSDFIPTMYTLTRAAHVQNVDKSNIYFDDELLSSDELMDERSNRENANSSIDTDDEFKIPTTVNVEETLLHNKLVNDIIGNKKRQPKITEYMKERKRLASTPKKISPAKRLRSSTGATNISTIFSIQKSPRNRH